MASDNDVKKPLPKPSPAVEAKPKAVAKPKTRAKPKTAVVKKVAASMKKPTPTKPAAKVKKAAPKLPAKAKPVAIPKEKIKKPKLVRDSFTMPADEYAALGEVKKMCLKAGVDVKKSELLRVGVAHIRKMDLAVLKQALAALAPLKAGRPKKDK